MTTAARAQGALAIAGLVAAVLVTMLLVATPVSSRPVQGSPRSVPASLRDLQVEVRGGDPFLAFGVADRLHRAGASLGAVLPAADVNALEDSTVIVYYDRMQLASAERVQALLGRGTLRRDRVFEPGADVTIVLGKDLSRL